MTRNQGFKCISVLVSLFISSGSVLAQPNEVQVRCTSQTSPVLYGSGIVNAETIARKLNPASENPYGIAATTGLFEIATSKGEWVPIEVRVLVDGSLSLRVFVGSYQAVASEKGKTVAVSVEKNLLRTDVICFRN